MYPSVASLLHKTGMFPERMLIPMLQDKIAAGMQEVQGKDEIRDAGKTLEGIGRIGKDNIELFAADGQEIEDVVPHHGHVGKAQTGRFCLYERGILPGHFHTVDTGSAPGGELKGNGTGAAEQVQDLEVLELVFVVQDIEEALLGKVRGGTGLVSGRGQDALSFQFSADDSHSCTTDLK